MAAPLVMQVRTLSEICSMVRDAVDGQIDDSSIRCTLPNCTCECFAPGKSQLRTCEQCRHGWVAHALDKLTTAHSFPSLHAEVVHSDIVFDIASLMLYGAQATPVRLRILLDRLFSVLKSEEVDRILEGLGWGHEDYARGYILQGTDGKVLERWTMASRDEELVILNQFLRFGETKSISEVMVQEIQARDSQSAQKKESNIRMFIERISGKQKVDNANEGSNVEGLRTTPESSRTLENNEGKRSQTSVMERDCSQRSSALQNVHLANLEQTVLKAGVVPSPTRSRNRISSSSSNPQTSKQSGTYLTLGRDSLSTSNSSVGSQLTSGSSLFLSTVKRHGAFSFNKGYRKMSLSKRRAWTPYSVLSNSKQVKCNTCNKWFYDKGTWKIHFGAVHLKVKYKCTVENCNMAFSSLRSRNRHSANPSPRIHRFVFNSRRGKRRTDSQDDETQIQLHDLESSEETNKIGDDDDDVAMVTEEIEIKEEDNKTTDDVTIAESGRDERDRGYCTMNESVTSNDHCIMDTDHRVTVNHCMEDNSMPDVSSETCVRKLEFTETQSVEADVNLDMSHQSPAKKDSSTFTVHHFKKRKSNAPRKVFIQKNEEDSDCEVEGVVFKTGDTGNPDDGIQDVQDEAGIDLGEIQDFNETVQDDENLSQSGHNFVSCDNTEKSRQSTDRLPASRSPSIDNLQLEHDTLRNHVAEQLGIGIDTCYYINTEGLPSCYLCSKTFHSKQTVKVHYQNVHLKLMHACTVDGCNAMFPSRRSRDRHSTNFNLHRKLFEKDAPLKDKSDDQTSPAANSTYPENKASNPIQSTSQILPDSERTSQPFTSTDRSLGINNTNHSNRHSSAAEIDLRLTRQEILAPPKHANSYAMQDNSAPSSSFDTSPPQRFVMQVDQNGLSPLAYNQSFSSPNNSSLTPTKELYPLKFTGNLICNICKKAYSTKDTLRTHYKNIHLREMHKCTVEGCNLMFSSVRSRNRHSQNPNLHRNCVGSDANSDVAEHDMS